MSGLFGGGPKPPALPPPAPVLPMPDPQDPAILAAQTQQLQSAAARSGRLSTILSAGGGSNYQGSVLGSP